MTPRKISSIQRQAEEGHLKGCHFPQQYLASLHREADLGLRVFLGVYSKMEKNMRKSDELRRSKEYVIDNSWEGSPPHSSPDTYKSPKGHVYTVKVEA